jgi:hypothetical protein
MRRKILILLIIVAIFGVVSKVSALETTWPPSPFGTNLTDESALTDMVKYFYEWGIFLGGLAVLISLLIGGFLYLTSIGNPARMTEAKDRIFSAIIGLVLLLAIYLILNTINPELTVLTMPQFGITEEELFKCDCAKDVACPDCEPNYKCIGDPNPGDGNKEGVCRFGGFGTVPCQEVALYGCTDCNCAASNTFSGHVDCYSFGEDGKTIKSAKVKGGCTVFLYPDETTCGTPKVIFGDNRSGEECDAPDIKAKYDYDLFKSIKIQEVSF